MHAPSAQPAQRAAMVNTSWVGVWFADILITFLALSSDLSWSTAGSLDGEPLRRYFDGFFHFGEREEAGEPGLFEE